MADSTDTVDLALDELEREPLPTHTREHAAPPAEDELEIDYAEDGQEGASRPEVGKTSPEPQREVPVAEGVAELQRRLEGEQLARRQAEERAAFAERAHAEATGQTQEANVSFLTSALDGVRQSMGAMQAALSQAYADQDFDMVGRLNVEIAKAAQRESTIETGLETLKNQPPPQVRQPPRADPVEDVARQLTPNAAAWIRAHPEFITDPQKNQRLMAAHYDAMADGLTADSPDYIRFVEDRVLGGRRDPEPRIERREPVSEQSRRSAPPPAPVSRGGNGVSNPTRVTLTADQRQTAHDNFPDEMREDPTGRKAEQAYARNMLILQREGRMKVN